MTYPHDAIVVGSGITGGWAAKELTEAGLRTLLLEAGSPAESWTSETDEQTALLVAEAQPVQSHCYACEGRFRNIFVNDLEHPYSTAGKADFAWIRSRRVGGRSLAWARTCFRLGPSDFEATPGGVGMEWPMSYAEIEPWYRRVERWIGITGHSDGLRQVPDSECLSGFAFNAAEELLRVKMARSFAGARTLIMSRVATLTVPHQGRPAYKPRDYQTHPLEDAAHFSSLSSTLPAARATSRLELRCNSVVSRILVDGEGRLARGVEVVDRITRERHEFFAPLIVLAAGTLESTRLLLNSGGDRFPEGLANSSGCLGRYLMDHLTGVGAVGEFPALRETAFQGGRPATSYMPRFRNLEKSDASFVGGYAMICDAFRPSLSHKAVFAERRDASPTVENDWVVRFWGFGECLPSRDNRVTLDRECCDSWGVPTLRIQFSWSDNDLAMARDMAVNAAETLEAGGARNVRQLDTLHRPGLAIHEMGTARMGIDPRTSVVNPYGQCHDLPNLFLVDGAIMPASPCQNPSLTYMALASRAANYAVAALRRGELRPAARAPRLCLGSGGMLR